MRHHRRAMPVRLFPGYQPDSPRSSSTITILRGLKPTYELHHGVEISDRALVTMSCNFFIIL